jgi:predicted transposase/invertase (TIGR01784 family)
MQNLVRFDWAFKRLLRQKANFVVLEGFLSTLLSEPIRIKTMLESESNQESESDKFNRVDMLAENMEGELFIIEIQNNRELDYFHRILYGTSKVITEHIRVGESYSNVKKVYSISIVYFDVGMGEDYVYRGRTEFRGIHCNDVLRLTSRQQSQFKYKDAGDLYPEYYILRVDGFDEMATTPLDEWIYFLKTGEIPETASAAGLQEARERLRQDKMSEDERRQYKAHMEAISYQRSVIRSSILDGRDEGLKEGRAEGLKEGRAEALEKGEAIGAGKKALDVARKALEKGLSPEDVMELTGLAKEDIMDIQTHTPYAGRK